MARREWAPARNGLALLLATLVLTAPFSASRLSRPVGKLPDVPALAEVSGVQRSPFVLMRGGRLDVRRVSASDLSLIDGVGTTRARALLAARRTGALASLADADRVPGIGPELAARLARALSFPIEERPR